MTSTVNRPDPDALLRQIAAEESENRFGRLKIFLGYASGVGKSLRMLEEARRRRERGQDVVVAATQPSPGPEAESILKKLEVIPLAYVNGQPVMDMPAILKRRPSVCVIDGLAYRNPPGARNAERWQDVRELLEEKISVITSINIQFIAEMQARVEAITKKHVTESVPQSFIASAHEIVVVDAPPETPALRSAELGIDPRIIEQRLSELRELALLLAADVVDQQLEAYLRQNNLSGSMMTQERILVCLTSELDVGAMIASGRRNADRFHGALYAVYARDRNLSMTEESMLAHNLDQASAAGASVHVLEDEDPVQAILEFARSNGITQIFVGQTSRTGWWQKLTGSTLGELIRRADGFDVCVFPN